MIRIVKAELQRLLRRRTLVVAAAGSLVFSLVAALAVFSSAGTSPNRAGRGATTVAALEGHGGGTEAFATGAAFLGFFVFVTVIALVAAEFSGGTFRALVQREPSRLRVIAGKLAGILLVAAGVVLFAEALTFTLSLLVAPGQDISTGNWFSLGSLGAALGDFGTVFGGVAGWAMFGTTLAVVFRSAPLALGVGFAWAGPFENIVVDSWRAGFRWFPGQVLAALIQGGSSELGLGRAALTAAVYVAAAATVAALLLTRKDVTA